MANDPAVEARSLAQVRGGGLAGSGSVIDQEINTTKEGANNLAVAISEQELHTEVDTTKEGANNLAVAISEQELRTEVDTTKEGANN